MVYPGIPIGFQGYSALFTLLHLRLNLSHGFFSRLCALIHHDRVSHRLGAAARGGAANADAVANPPPETGGPCDLLFGFQFQHEAGRRFEKVQAFFQL